MNRRVAPRIARRALCAVLAVFFVLVAVTASATPAPTTAAPTAPLVYAVVVGHNDGWGVLPQLHYADDDALRFYQLAVRLAPATNVALLTELDVQTWRRLQLSGATPPPYLPPTKERLQQVLALFKKQIAAARLRDPARPVHLYFFFSGHGEKGYFLLKKKGKEAAEGAFTARDLRAAFADSQATLNGLFIDACKSQSLFVAKGPADPELGPDFSGLIRKVERAAQQQPIGVLTSTMSDRPAGEARDIGGGYFSHVLISGLAGAADADSDGVVRYGELAAFVSFHTRRISGQQPWFRPPLGKLRAPLVRLAGRKDLLELPPGLGGHFAVFDAKTGTLRLELHKTAGQWTRLILEPGSYKVVWVRSQAFGLQARVTLSGQRAERLLRPRFTSQVSLAAVGLHKGSGESASDANAAERIGAFDPATSGFDQAFSPRVVEMLQVAYSSGLAAGQPLFTRRRARGPAQNLLGLTYGYLGAPTTPYAAGHGLSLGYARRLLSLGPGQLLVGGRALYARSTHTEAQFSRDFSIHRIALQAEASYRFRFTPRFELGLGLYGGWQLVLLLKQEPSFNELGQEGRLISTLTGDAGAFRGGTTLDLALRLFGPLWATISGGFGFEVLREQAGSGETRLVLFGRPQLLAGVGYAF